MMNPGLHPLEKSAAGEPHVPLMRETGADAIAVWHPPGAGRERETRTENAYGALSGVVKKRKWVASGE